MVCLSTLLRRSFPELAMASHGESEPLPNADSEAINQLLRELTDWMRHEGVWDALSSEERTLMQQELGTWHPTTRARVQWRVEALKMLAWCLYLVDEPGVYDEPADIDALLIELPGPETLTPKSADTPKQLLDSAELRSRQELRRAWSTAKLWHWRARIEAPRRTGQGDRLPAGVTPEEVDRLIRGATEKAAADELFQPIHDDFPVYGRPFSRLDDKQFSTVRRIAAQRFHAMNWICGRAAGWDALPITI